MVGWKFTKFLMSYLKPEVSFSLNIASIFITMRENSSFFSWNFIWFGQKEPVKVQNYRFLTAHVKFYQIFTLIGSFCWNYIKLQLKKYMRVVPLKSDAKLEEKLVCCFKKDKNLVYFELSTRNSQNFHFYWFLSC